jgi:hypothetical protein
LVNTQVPPHVPRPTSTAWEMLERIAEGLGLEFQQNCAQIVDFALRRNVNGTRNCRNQTASRLVVRKNAYRGCLEDALKIEGD